MDQRLSEDNKNFENGDYTVIRDEEEVVLGVFDKPLPFFGCGIGWFSFLLGFVCPLMWYYASFLHFIKYYHKDPRERTGLASCVAAASIFTLAALITTVTVVLLKPRPLQLTSHGVSAAG
ncbi:hypothetical protein Nepgr_005620 [Nepenthes gracilis]|uniref:60S ribosomal protein L18a-like protein n=1 Tax=Nepenthes gracilis TaxID=150966 RepID=A0AAD3XGS3_NEPGR|nr:hypothetical protein Nepgr_005620 [Nepenthes gracilis]